MLTHDPLFHGPDDPCMLEYPQCSGRDFYGTVIVCPGGNYEFLSPLEGLPVVEWLAQHNIGAVVLKYRLLPHYDLDDALDDLEAAIARVRECRPGPVAALGFSAGGHLIASLALRAAQRSQKQPLDAQVLVYPGIDCRDWKHPEYNGFFNLGRWKIPTKAAKLHRGQEALLGGAGFAAPPTCLVGSTDDTCTPNEQHTDIYHRALDERDIPNVYLRDSFGEHGFELKGGWTPGCVKWLKSRNFGGMKQMPGRHAMSLRMPAPRVLQDSAYANAEPMDFPTDDSECPACDHDDESDASEASPFDEGRSCGKPRFPPAMIEVPVRQREIARELSSSSSSTESVFACTPAPQAFPMDLHVELGGSLASSEDTFPTDGTYGLPGGAATFGAATFGAASKPFAKPTGGKPKAGSGSSLKNLNKPLGGEEPDLKRAKQLAMVPSDENVSSFTSSFPTTFSTSTSTSTFPSTFSSSFPTAFAPQSGFASEPKNKAPPTTSNGKGAVGGGSASSGKAAMVTDWPTDRLASLPSGRTTRGSTTAAAKSSAMPPPTHRPTSAATVDSHSSLAPPHTAHHAHASSSLAPPPAMVFDLDTHLVGARLASGQDGDASLSFAPDAVEV